MYEEYQSRGESEDEYLYADDTIYDFDSRGESEDEYLNVDETIGDFDAKESEHKNIHEDETTGDSDARRGSQDEYLYVAEAIHDEYWYRNLPVSADETDEDFYLDEDEYFYAFKTIRERKKRKRIH